MAEPRFNKVKLIPWDPVDERHFQRMCDQRVACGWLTDGISDWKAKVLRGVQTFYWVVLSEELPGAEKLLAGHVAKYPKEAEPLIDTATRVFSATREPTNAAFTPIGHIALELPAERPEPFVLPASTIWIGLVYVSWQACIPSQPVTLSLIVRRAVQASGLGRSAMAQAEAIGAAAPLNSTVVALNTITKEFQAREDYLSMIYDDRGLQRPGRSNEAWYQGQGYEIFEEHVVTSAWENPRTGEKMPLPLKYLKKALV